LRDLEDRLTANGYESLPWARPIIGGEGHAVLPSGFVVGAWGAALLGPGSSGPNDYTATLSGGFGMLDLGFALVHRRAALLSLLAGIGGYGYSVDIGNGSSTSFDDALANPARSTSVGTGGVLGSLTLGFDGRVDIGEPKAGRQGFFSLGARLGVLYGPPIGEWSLANEGTATGGPTTGLTGGFAAMAVGFGERPERATPFPRQRSTARPTVSSRSQAPERSERAPTPAARNRPPARVLPRRAPRGMPG
jgi:hypothetical protein